MSTFNKVNIKELNQIEEIVNGNYLIVENSTGTNIIDFKDFVIGPNNASFYTSVATISSQVNTLSATVESRQPGFTTVLRYAPTGGGSASGITFPAGVNNIRVTCVGGGGGGGGSSSTGAGGGGGGGATTIKYFTNVRGKTYSYVVGAGGGAGAAGGQSTFTVTGETVVIAPGGSAGTVGTAGNAVAGGAGGLAGSGGDIPLAGSSGENGIAGSAAAFAAGGRGAPGFMGAGAGRGGNGSNVSGLNGSDNTGAGGGGGSAGGAGGSGAAGVVIIEY